MEAVVGHHRHDHAVTAEPSTPAQVQRGERQQLVAVDDGAQTVDRQHAVAVPVEGEADRVPAARHHLGQRLHVGRAAVRVDVATVGCIGHHGHVRTQAPEDLRSHPIGGPIGAVQQHLQPAEVQLAEARVELAKVVLRRAPQLAHATDRGGLAELAALQLALDRELAVVGELVSVGAEELDPVVLIGVVRGGHHHGEVEAVPREQQGRRGRWQDAGQQRVATRRAHPGRKRRLQHRSRLARVAHDHHLRALGRGQACRRPCQ